MSVRVRFAPSPTGFLHVGGARTALFNWLFARHHGGKFVLRIEDTDRARNTSEAVEVILNGLQWLGLDWDEGPDSEDLDGKGNGDCGPYFQSQRSAHYKEAVDSLLRRDLAYAKDGAIWFRMTREPIIIPDLVVGDVRRELTDREQASPDFVIVRSDGQPVFHLVNVVDDLKMGITHVIRGEDHLSNTSKHIALFEALNAAPPKFAHIPIILNSDGSKMSKRDLGASLGTYARDGFVPEAVLNYFCLLGWSPKNDEEIMPLGSIVERFDLSGVQRHNAKFDYEKLKWMNGEYIRALSPNRFDALARTALSQAGVDLAARSESYVGKAIATCAGKVKTLAELSDYAGFYFQDSIQISEDDYQMLFTEQTIPAVAAFRAKVQSLTDCDEESLQAALKEVAVAFEMKPRVLVHPIRVSCSGQRVGPSL